MAPYIGGREARTPPARQPARQPRPLSPRRGGEGGHPPGRPGEAGQGAGFRRTEEEGGGRGCEELQ